MSSSVLAAPTASLYQGVGAIYKGPGSETVVKGPDGSVITSEAEGASLADEEELVPIVGPAPIPAYHVPARPAPEKAKKGPEVLKVQAAPEEVVSIAEEAVAGVPKGEAIIIAVRAPAEALGLKPAKLEKAPEDEEDDDDDEDGY